MTDHVFLGIIAFLLVPQFLEKAKAQYRPMRNWWQRRAIHKAAQL